MKQHPTAVEGFDGSLQELAQRVCRMRYDLVERFFYLCAEEFGAQAAGDWKRGRPRLSGKLDMLTMSLAFSVAPQLRSIAALCAPHMKDELADER